MSAGDGDGWVVLPDGSRRWGRFGSAGLLLHAQEREPSGAPVSPHAPSGSSGGRILMQHRAVWSHQGGTWGVPGGARDPGETPVQAALREFGEEVAGEAGEIELIGLHRQEHTVWRYDTVLARTAQGSPLEAANWESDEVRWVGVGEVANLRLLPAFGHTWPALREALGRRLAVDVDAAALLPDADAQSLERLRDDLAALAAVGIATEALPEGVLGDPLHRWFPRVRMLIAADTAAPDPVDGVAVLPASADTVTDGPAGAGSAGRVRTSTLLVTDRQDISAVNADNDADNGVRTVPPSWLTGVAGLASAAARQAPGA